MQTNITVLQFYMICKIQNWSPFLGICIYNIFILTVSGSLVKHELFRISILRSRRLTGLLEIPLNFAVSRSL